MTKHIDTVLKRQLDPFEIVLCALFGISGTLQLFVGPSATSSSALLPTPFRLLWLALMVAGCAVALVGQFSPKVWGYLVEQIGLLAAGSSLVIFGISILIVQLQRGGFTPTMIIGGPLTIGLGVAFLWKRQQIRATLKVQPK